MSRMFWWPLVGAAVALAGVGSDAVAAPIVFGGSDAFAGPGDARVNTDAAALDFASAAWALGTLSHMDFESAPHGAFDHLEIVPGVTASLDGVTTDGGIRTTPTYFGAFSPTTIGYNTTPGGEQFLALVPEFDIGTATLQFTFAKPIQAFGVYITGLSEFVTGDLHVVFEGGSSHDFEVPGLTTGGVQFFGFTDAGAEIFSVDLRMRNIVSRTDDIARDIMAVDDVSFVAAVPEPSTFALAAVSLAMFVIARGSRLRSRSTGRSPIPTRGHIDEAI